MALRHVLMILLHEKPASGYELTKAFEEVAGNFWQASHQQVYRELSRMRDEGLVDAEDIAQQGRPDKKDYSLTEEGLTQLREWLRQPTVAKRSNDEGLVRLLGARLLGREALMRDLQAQGDAHRQRLEMYRQMEQAEDFANNVGAMAVYERMAYLALLKGIRMEAARAAWTEEALSLLERWGEFPADAGGRGRHRG